uniref:Uncharacterized protein n=1 Tax=Octopus bimaculoides TaxID=37653 RepID=A0A0L8GM08_OCTBM
MTATQRYSDVAQLLALFDCCCSCCCSCDCLSCKKIPKITGHYVLIRTKMPRNILYLLAAIFLCISVPLWINYCSYTITVLGLLTFVTVLYILGLCVIL